MKYEVFPFTPEQLESWLSDKPSDAVVGTACSPCGCPLANFLEDQGYDCIVTEITIEAGPDRVPDTRGLGFHLWRTPGWARGFIKQVDAECRGSVLAEQALSALQKGAAL